MAERIKVLLEDVRAKAQLEREMSLARTVQETLLPGRDAVTVGPLRLAGLVVHRGRVRRRLVVPRRAG